ncbi:MAG: carbon-nitrogen hydrolase family protein [Hyphomicrobiaceae bacterium]
MSGTQKLSVALVQMRSGREVDANLAAAETLVREAAAGGARYVQTPENTGIMELDRERLRASVAPFETDRGIARFRRLAAELAICLHIGSMAFRGLDGDRLLNRSVLIGPDGEILATYDKIHMFDVDLPSGESYRESRNFAPGSEAVVAHLGGVGLGLSICYDLRFPALYRTLAKAGAGILAVPSAFTRQTGEAHWQVLLRARAIETGSFVLAAAQGGRHENGRETYGHSLVVDPWGEVIAETGTEPGVIHAELDLARIADARGRIPALAHDRAFAPMPASPTLARQAS